jgi:type II secretory pathway pseudopilin PulG
MRRVEKSKYRAFTLLEIILVLGIMLAITALALPNFIDEIRRNDLEGSARQLRSLLTLVAANASFDATRYRIRFAEEDEEDPLGGDQQPLIEREDDPLEEPEVFNLVTAPWAIGTTLLGHVWCAEVRLGRPTAEELLELDEMRSEIADALDEAFEEFSPHLRPVIFEPDGVSEWATFVLADAPRDVEIEELEDYPRIEVIFEGSTGMVWLQRPFYEEELELFEEKNWPVVLRQDFLNPKVLTEDDVLELHEIYLRR